MPKTAHYSKEERGRAPKEPADIGTIVDSRQIFPRDPEHDAKLAKMDLIAWYLNALAQARNDSWNALAEQLKIGNETEFLTERTMERSRLYADRLILMREIRRIEKRAERAA